MKKFIMVLVGMFVLGLNSAGAVGLQDLQNEARWILHSTKNGHKSYMHRDRESDRKWVWFTQAVVHPEDGIIIYRRFKIDINYKEEYTLLLQIYNYNGILLDSRNFEAEGWEPKYKLKKRDRKFLEDIYVYQQVDNK